ncbi:MAG: NAD-dependent epimerase/dehydratase family protein [Chitinophagaceae bacterium]|nr:NAD-dependent epimerase/dehydratase family protein [Chitinophagaceae bacterium]
MILITGASGFLGQHLVKSLSQLEPVAVRALYHSTLPSQELLQLPNTSWMQCDLLDVFAVEEAFQDINEVYHCAGMVSFESEDKYKVQIHNRNITANVVNAALVANIRKLIHVSSIATLGRGNLSIPLTEDSFWEESKNNTAYARSKYLAEMEVWRAMAEGLNAAIINPSIILGTGDWTEGSAKLMNFAFKEFPFYTQGINGWVAVQDVVNAMQILMKSDVCEERFILSEGNHSYRHIFTTMANALGKKPPHIAAPYWATSILWRWNWLLKKTIGKRATITKETTRTANTQCYYDNSKFLNHFPNYSFTTMEDTIQEMAKAYLRSKN